MSLELCSEGHDEVCFESDRFTSCPACKLADEMQEKIDEKQKEIDDHVCEPSV